MKTKDDWEELIRSDFCLYNVSIPFHAIQYSNEYLGGPKYKKLFLYIEGSIGYYYENFKDHFTVGEYCLKIFLKDKKTFRKYLKFWHNEFKKLNELFNKIRKIDLKKLKTIKLANLLEKLYKKSVYWHGIAYNVDSIDATLNPLIQKLIEKNYPGQRKSKLSEIYNKLTFPDILSYVNRMNIEKLELIKKIKKNKNKKKIAKFVEKYYWINFNWGESKEYTQKDILDEIKKYNYKTVTKELSEQKKKNQELLEKKKKLLKEIQKKTPIIKDYITIFDEYAVLHDLRKEGQVKSVYYIRNIYKELAKRLKVDFKLLYYYWPMELVNVIKKNKKVNIELLKKRSKGWFCEYYNNGKSIEYFGKKALEKRNKSIGLDIEQQKELSGIGASQGRVIGTAKICLSAKIANKKISKGDILVTGMTMPEFIPAMNKSAAVVTDEGGLTCHAAIISRELGKPCVVGTKLATRIIKDGNKIEVNANHGIVKIIK